MGWWRETKIEVTGRDEACDFKWELALVGVGRGCERGGGEVEGRSKALVMRTLYCFEVIY